MVDKDRFPRDKVCGDALSGQVVNILKRLPGEVYPDFLRISQKTPKNWRKLRMTVKLTRRH